MRSLIWRRVNNLSSPLNEVQERLKAEILFVRAPFSNALLAEVIRKQINARTESFYIKNKNYGLYFCNLPLKHHALQNDETLSDEQNYFVKSKYFQKKIFLAIFQFATLYTHAQYYEEKPDPEIAGGIKIVKGNIIYGRKSFYKTDPNSIGLQALVRYDIPIKISSLSPYQQRYVNFVVESGYLFCKANVFDSSFRDPITNMTTHDKSKNPTYLPVYLGLYNRSVFSIGVEVFYWKGLGAQDIWGTKFLSLGYNAQNFRVTVSGEWYAQTKNIRFSGTFLSIDFLWKYIIKD